MKKRIRPKMFGVLLVSFTVILLGYQNCGDVSVLTQQQASVSNTGFSERLCTRPNEESRVSVKTIFIVDMSRSNFESFSGLGTTDPAGARFDVIEQFLRSSCVAQESQFAVIGFSTRLLQPSLSLACVRDVFKNQTGALGDLTTLESLSRDEAGATVYENSFACARSIIESDSAQSTETTSYQVFFLSDGLPTDSNGSVLTTFTSVESSVVSLMGAAAASAKSDTIRLIPILYGQNQLGSNLQTARNLFTTMARIGQSASTTIDNVSQLNLCDSLNEIKRAPFALRSFSVVNLTAVQRNGVWVPDSDIDGLSDAEEVVHGFDPQNPRSSATGSKVLDSFCSSRSSECLPVRSSCSQENAFGFNSCDVSARGLTDAIDSDNDGIIDLLEALRTGRHSFPDMNVDSDDDGKEDFFEGLNGMHPMQVDSLQAVASFPRTFTGQNSSCPQTQDSYSYDIPSFFLVPTLSVQLSSGGFRNHRAGENVYLIYYISESVSNSQVAAEVYGKFIYVSQDSMRSSGDFKKMGVVNGRFIPSN